MKNLLLLVCLFIVISCAPKEGAPPQNTTKAEYAMVIHGGAGTILKENMSDELEKEYRDKLNEALTLGEKMLKEGSDATDVVVKVINLMEDSPLFNAGKGAVFTHSQTNELDASIMNGKNKNAGAVGGVRTIKNPINAARAVMDQSEHVMMVGAGAEDFAKSKGIELINPEYFKTERRWNSIQKILKTKEDEPDQKHGTVGCVVLDKKGNIAAGTSTGGMTNKKYNRIGDSPIIGAGTYADNATCGISCTGHGEFFIRYAVAHDVAARMEYLGESIANAGDEVINKKLKEIGATGGLVGLDKYGNIAMPFNTAGMYRGYIKPQERKVLIYQNN